MSNNNNNNNNNDPLKPKKSLYLQALEEAIEDKEDYLDDIYEQQHLAELHSRYNYG